ncbi:murein L,D-transpeptidase [Rhodoplanes sp. SY1]|uniref:L,D-transpeptidase family protein n=1 Tax=Rhodoplanes sp. SY1 TaxID=3166646 RepID=UPI0038B53A76
MDGDVKKDGGAAGLHRHEGASRHASQVEGLDRRAVVRALAGGVAGLAAFAGRAQAQGTDAVLDQLIQQSQGRNFGQGFDSASRTILMPKASLPTLDPSTAQTTEQFIPRYEEIVARGGWPSVPQVERLRLGNRNPAVPVLRDRLAVSGDIDPAAAGAGDVFDSYVEAAVRRFQARHGLTVDGVVRQQTLKALNVPAQVRLAQLRINVVRLRTLSSNLGNKLVVANIPAAQIEAIEGGVVVSRHVTVAGKPDRASPDLQSRIVEVNFNPYWTVPVSIVRKDLIPRMQEEPDYLTKNHIRIFDGRGAELQPTQINWNSNEAVNYRFKQDPGDFNSLGSIRINFPSKDGVYMHDTPSKSLFGEDFRFHSSGCMRVQNVRELVVWLLSETPGWSRAEIDAVIKSGERKDARLAAPVPLYWVYVTAWVTPDGVVQFRDDIYSRDGLAASQGGASRG